MGLAAAAVAAGWAGPVGREVAASEPARVTSARYVVKAGDTLWSIAVRMAPGRDPRPLVDAIAEANAVDPGALVPGQPLVVPTQG